ncbi:NADPH-dependent FMN reductase [Planctomyces sp. SH-PL62]|uniref:NADPH-dependent FMN reductase n=1 Tax=Planctomyces sp. SH-PL62 TaxID=1636152 RepID=UPI00078D283C|nr:NADPH-dependent FMN reductase [Planctomyces sp. SH-PL62]AMV40185.1 FMN-dependent NADPH-azoreductase [Planctomyces sp. SH-PL62]
MRILAVSGSLRARSSNTAALKAAVKLAPPDMQIHLFEGIASLPHFNPDVDESGPPPSVHEWRRQVGAARGLLICSPEYARGVAGVMKNALDWLVRGPEFYEKPVAVINASPRSTHADASLRLTLATMSGRVIEAASIAVPLLGRGLDADGIAADPSLSSSLRDALRSFADAIGAGS